MLTRRVNILKSIISKTDIGLGAGLEKLNITFKFQSVLPTDEKELVEMLYTATGGKPTLSQKTAVGANPVVKSQITEIEQIEEEKAEEKEAASQLAGSFEME